MSGKTMWIGIPPSPGVFAQLDPESVTVLGFLAWCFGANRPTTASDLASLPDRNGVALGIVEAKEIVRELGRLKIVSVLGMNNGDPLGIFLGGFQPPARRFTEPRPVRTASAVGRPTPAGPRRGAPRPSRPKRPKPELLTYTSTSYTGPTSRPKVLIEHPTRGLPSLRTTTRSPEFVLRDARRLRARQLKLEETNGETAPVEAAEERLNILTDRIALYEKWLRAEPDHWVLADHLERKRKALPELTFQLERVRMNQARSEAK